MLNACTKCQYLLDSLEAQFPTSANGSMPAASDDEGEPSIYNKAFTEASTTSGD